MNKYFLSFLLLLLCLNSGYSQSGNEPVHTKSAEGYQKERMADSVSYILNHIHLVRDASPDSALNILFRLYNTCVQAGYFEGAGASSAEIGGTFLRMGDYNKAEKYILYSRLLPELN